MKPVAAIALSFGLLACGRQEAVNPPTEPAAPVRSPEAVQPPTSSVPSAAGTGPVSFIGRWATEARWCPEGQTPDRAVVLTPFTYQAGEARCDLVQIDEVAGGYQAQIACRGQAGVTQERARFSSSGPTLEITWLDRAGQPSARLLKCTTLADPMQVGG